MQHPTPAHIRLAIKDRPHDEATARGEYVPQWVLDAIRRGVSDACAEHDRNTNCRSAA